VIGGLFVTIEHCVFRFPGQVNQRGGQGGSGGSGGGQQGSGGGAGQYQDEEDDLYS
jgi:hypothetical protein